MSDDRFMDDLGRAAREERSSDETAQELAAPFTRAELDAMIARSAEALAVTAARPIPTPVTTRRRRSRATLTAALTMTLAMAAGATLWLRAHRSAGDDATTYDLVVQGAARDVRGDDGAAAEGPVPLARDGVLTLTFRPRAPAHGDVDARAFVAQADDWRPLVVRAEPSAEGAIRMRLGPDAIARLPDGTSRLVLFIGDPSRLPRDAADARSAFADAPRGVQARVLDVAVH